MKRMEEVLSSIRIPHYVSKSVVVGFEVLKKTHSSFQSNSMNVSLTVIPHLGAEGWIPLTITPCSQISQVVGSDSCSFGSCSEEIKVA